MGRTDFPDQFRKKTIRYKRIGYNVNFMRQSACLVINQITVDTCKFAVLLFTPVDRASDSMMVPSKSYSIKLVETRAFVGAQLMIFVCFRFPVVFGSQWISNCDAARCIC